MLTLLLPLALVALQDRAPSAAGPDAIAARGAGLSVTVAEVDALLVDRHALSPTGREALEVLLKSRLLDALARESGITVSEEDIARRWKELDLRTRETGQAGGLAQVIAARGLGADEFREFLRLALVQERLTRRALGMGPEEPVTEAQQEVWIGQAIAERGLERPVPPWTDGVAARCGTIVVSADEFAAFLRARLPREDVQEACWHLLLQRGLEKRLPDLSAEARERAVQDEMERRRAKHEREFPAMTFEQRLGALGRSLEQLQRDPSVRIAALSRLWVDRKHGEEGLRRTFEQERDLFESRYGRAADVRLLFLVAGRFVNDLVPRTFEEAERKLEDMRTRVGDVADFEGLVVRFSEETSSRKENGQLGFLTRELPAEVPEELRAAVFDFLDAGGEVGAEGAGIGPIRLDTGVALLWVSNVRPSPPWEVMKEHVHTELRRRLVVDLMPTGAMEVLLFAEDPVR